MTNQLSTFAFIISEYLFITYSCSKNFQSGIYFSESSDMNTLIIKNFLLSKILLPAGISQVLSNIWNIKLATMIMLLDWTSVGSITIILKKKKLWYESMYRFLAMGVSVLNPQRSNRIRAASELTAYLLSTQWRIPGRAVGIS